MKLEYRQFGGMRPAVDERVLERVEATDAVDCDLRYKTVKPFLAPDVTTQPRTPIGYDSASVPSSDISHLHDILHFDTTTESTPKGFYEVNERGTCLAPSAVARDEHERVYFSRPDGGIFDRGQTDGVGGFEERPVGVPAPVGDSEVPEGDYITANVEPREDSEAEKTFNSKWFWYVEVAEGNITDPSGAVAGEIPNDLTTNQPARGAIDDASMEYTTVNGPLGSPAFRYYYTEDNTSASHVAPTTKWDRADYHFILYSELTSQKGRFIGTVYPDPSVRKIDTDAYVGGTLADAVMGVGDIPGFPLYEYQDLYYSPASAEYSHYRSYIFTYVTDRGEEGPPSAPTEPVPVLPTEMVDLTLYVSSAALPISAVRIYRTETTEAGTAFFFVEEVPFVPVAEPILFYQDLYISVDLPGDTIQSLNWTTPPADLKGLVLSTKGFYAGYSGSQLYLSELYLAYAWPVDYAIDFTGDIKHIARYGDMLCVFTDREIALIVGNTPLEVRKIKLEGFEQLTSIFSSTEMDGILYFSTPIGVAAVSGTNVAVVTDDLVSERWWRDNINEAEIRIVSFDNALYVLQQPDGQVYRVGLQSDGGGFVRLSDEYTRDLYTSSFYLGVVFLLSLPEGGAYVFNTGADVPRTVVWRGRTEVADVPMAVISVRCLAEAYPVTFRIYNEIEEQLELTLTSDKIRKLPVMRRGREWSFEIEGPTNIVSLEVGTSGRVR